MVRRYAHLAADHLAAYVGKVNLVIANDNPVPAPGAVANENHGTYMAHQQGALN